MGLLVGPYLAGALSDSFGRGVPMVVFSILLAGVIVALLASPPGGTEPHGHDPVLKTLKRGRGSILVVAALLLFGTAVLGETASAVLGPLRLDHNGLSASAIGAIFSGGAALLVVVSLLMMRHEKKMLRMPIGMLTMAALAVVLVLLAATQSTVPIAVALVLRTAILGAIYTVAFPFAAMGAVEAGIGLGAVYAAMQLVAGTSNAIGPLAAGKIGEAFGDATAYGICAALSGAAVVWLALAGRRIRANGGSTAPSETGGRV